MGSCVAFQALTDGPVSAICAINDTGEGADQVSHVNEPQQLGFCSWGAFLFGGLKITGRVSDKSEYT